MKKIIAATAMTLLPALQADDYGMLTQAVSKLIDENRQMRSEILLLKGETERLQKLELEVRRMQAQCTESADANRTEAGETVALLPEKSEAPGRQSQKKSLREPFRPYRAVVTADRLNVRGGPGEQYGVFDALHEGNEVTVEEKGPEGWNRISWSNRLGWVNAQWLAPLAAKGADE